MMVAVAVAVGFQIPSGANLLGYRAELLEDALDAGYGDVRVRPLRGNTVRDAVALAARLTRFAGVIEATPIVTAPASINANGRARNLGVAGVDPRATYHPYHLAAGRPLGDNGDGVLLGTSTADALGVGVGDEIELRVLLSTYPRLLLDDGGYGIYTLTVRGLVGGGARDAIFVTRAFLASELGDDDGASAIMVHLRDHDAAQGVANAIRGENPTLDVRAWIDDSHYLRSSVRTLESLASASWAMGTLAVGIPVLALLYISTLNRRRQIGLLTAMGFSRTDLFLIFLLQAFMLGFAGVVGGSLVAIGVVRYLVAHPLFDWDSFVVRPVLTIHDLVRTTGAVLFIAVAAGTYPAWRAARLDPSRILRGIE
jgi:lipoprotein-releasing system permease protein